MVRERMPGGDSKQENHSLKISVYLLNDTLYNSQQTYYCGFPIRTKATYENKSNI